MSVCPKNTFSGVHVLREWITGIVLCRYCGAMARDVEAEEQAIKLARTTDAATSHAAAKKMAGSYRQTSLKSSILTALRAQDGQTSGEIADSLGLRHDQIWRRVSDLKNDGAIIADGERVWHGRAQQVWWLA